MFFSCSAHFEHRCRVFASRASQLKHPLGVTVNKLRTRLTPQLICCESLRGRQRHIHTSVVCLATRVLTHTPEWWLEGRGADIADDDIASEDIADDEDVSVDEVVERWRVGGGALRPLEVTKPNCAEM